jgi:AAA15 family ATPase/GTPase
VEILPMPNGIFLGYENMEELIPINLAGDGVRKYINIITTLAEKQNGIVLIDEIENGLHYTAHKLLWESVLQIAETFNIQLFITTHNIETLKYLKETLEKGKFTYLQKETSVFYLAHIQKAGMKAYKYSFEGFSDAIENETEIR